jgi:hypothetical protein
MSHPNWALAEGNAPQATMNWPGYAAPYAMAPAQYAPEQHYGVVPAQYAITPPLYGAPAQVHGSRRRPGTVTAAAVIAFIAGGLGTLISGFYLLVLVGLSVGYQIGSAAPVVVILYGAVLLALADSALFIWGGVRALMGRKAMLTVMSSIHVGLTLLGLVCNLAMGTTSPAAALVRALFGLIFVGPILILLAQRSSKEFFRARRGGTI